MLPASPAASPDMPTPSRRLLEPDRQRRLPVDALPSAGIAITPRGKRKSGAADALSMAFRALPVPVIGRIRDGAFILDLRCLDDETGFVAQLDQLTGER